MDRRGAGGCGAAPVGTEAGGSPDSDGGPGAGPTVVPLPGAAELIKGCWRRSRVWVRRAGGRPCPPPPPPGGLWDNPAPPHREGYGTVRPHHHRRGLWDSPTSPPLHGRRYGAARRSRGRGSGKISAAALIGWGSARQSAVVLVGRPFRQSRTRVVAAPLRRAWRRAARPLLARAPVSHRRVGGAPPPVGGGGRQSWRGWGSVPLSLLLGVRRGQTAPDWRGQGGGGGADWLVAARRCRIGRRRRRQGAGASARA